ncbi:MAG TPA: TonB-dependent receptor plug domain-containing protein, partial [Chitinophagaceae bacterium]
MRKKQRHTSAYMNKLFLLFSLLLFSAAAFAQTISGTVTDEESKPVSGATVTVKGTVTSVATDAAGKFSINAPGTATLVISYVGFVTQEIPLNGRSTLAVNLGRGEATALTEVVVTTLGVKKESKKLGYSVTSVNADELVKQRTLNLGESLEGKVAGLNITPPAAGAGSSNQLRLRGQVGFAGATNSPLIVVNGLPLDQGARGNDGNNPSRDRGDNLNNLNPDDIETMTVLKGATAAALYGSRAAAGAIIITTKSGQKNQGIGVDFTSSYTTMEALSFMDEITQTEYGQGTL